MCAYSIKQDPPPSAETLVYPERIERLKKIYDSYGVTYIIQPEDERERIFETWVKERPDTHKKSIYSIYRVRTDDRTKKEYYFYNMQRTVLMSNDMPRPPLDTRIGLHMKPIVTTQIDEITGQRVKVARKHENVFELEWNSKEVKKLLDSSYVPCKQFYIGIASPLPEQVIQGRHYSIQNMNDFIEGSFDDLIDLGRLGVSYETPSLYLVEAARKTEKENREKTVGMREPRAYG